MKPTLVSEKVNKAIVSLDDLHEHAVQTAENIFAATHEVPFRWILHTRKRRLVMIDTQWDQTDADKNAAMAVIKLMIFLLDVDRYAHFGEAWVATFDKGKVWDGRPAGEQEDREDIMFVASWDAGGDHRWTRYGVVHADTPRARLLARDDWLKTDTTGFSGRMVDLFRPGVDSMRRDTDALFEYMQVLAARQPLDKVLEQVTNAYYGFLKEARST